MASEPSDLRHVRGIVSTVRTYDPNTDGTQFFICLSDMPALDALYTPFGRVVEGLDVVEKISKVPVDEHNQTDKPVRILSVTIEKTKTR
jgi:peptidyl-prolyl cis-trans isomerase B (cyclophilin B)